MWVVKSARWESPDGAYYYDPEAAAQPSATASYFKPPRGALADQAMEYLPWQRKLVIDPLFGWKRAADGLRRFREVFVFVPKKNGKSIFCSALGPHLAFCDDERGAQVYVSAGDEEQARIVWADAATMVESSDEFRDEYGVEALANSLVQESTSSFFRPLTSKAATKHGFDVHAVIFDELHVQKSRTLYDTIRRGVSARQQPVIMVITTAGDDRQSICYEEYEAAKRVITGVTQNAALLPIVFEPAPTDHWADPEVWHRVNPGLGTVKELWYMEGECQKAKDEPRKRNDFLRLDLNVWTESRTVWITPEAWRACEREGPEPADLRTLPAYLGFDLSETIDLTAVVAAFRRPDPRPAVEVEVVSESADAPQAQSLTVDFSVDLKAWFFMPQDVYFERVRERKDGVPWEVWKRDGWLRVTEGAIIDYRAIREVVLREIVPTYEVAEAGFDPYNARQLVTTFAETDGLTCVEVRQGFLSLSAPSKLLEGLVRAGRVAHDGNPVLAWCFANAEVATDPAGNIKPQKPGGDARSTRRIDGVSATVTALARMIVAPPKQPEPMLTFMRW